MLTSVEKFITGGCDVGNIDESRKICRSRGGESCAFDGAMIVLQPVSDTAHIVHGPMACLGNSWENRGSLSSHGNLHKMGFTTAMNEMDVIYGSEEKLLNAIKEVHSEIKPKAIFVYSTCVSGLIGEDIEAVCRKAEDELGLKIIPVNAPGFAGPKNLGNRIAGDVLLEHVVGTGEAPFITDYDINLIGEYNIAGDQWLVEPVLQEAGFRILSRITGDAAFEEITYAHQAKLNVVVCGRALINVAKQMEYRFGIPYVEVSFFGKTEMRNALRAIGAALDLLNQINQTDTASAAVVGGVAGQIKQSNTKKYMLTAEKVEAVIEKKERELRVSLAKYKHLIGKKAVLYSGGVKSWALITALKDLGIEVVGVGVKKSTFEDEEKIKAMMGPDSELIEDTSPKNLLRIIKTKSANMLIAGGRNQYLGVKEGIPFVDVNQERHTPYASYEGLLNLAERISNGMRYYDRESMHNIDVGGRCVDRKPNKIKAKTVHIDPLQHSPSIGAAIALQGVDSALPIIHGAQGCNFLGKVLITKHYHEPIAMASTKLFTEDVVMGGDEALEKTIKGFVEKNKPDVIGILTTALSEVRGDDIAGVIKKMKADLAERDALSASGLLAESNPETKLVHVSVPDYAGSIEFGYAEAVKQLVGLAKPATGSNFISEVAGSKNSHRKVGIKYSANNSYEVEIDGKNCTKDDPASNKRQLNVLVGSHLTPADVTELKEIVESFEVYPLVLPDLSALDGSRQGISALATGGTKIEDIEVMGRSEYTIAIGASMKEPAKILSDRFGIDFKVFESIAGLHDTDKFLRTLADLSGKQIPVRFERQRKILLDGMRDAHLYISGKKICTALENDLSIQLSRCLYEAGADVELSVVPVKADSADKIVSRNTTVGDIFSIHGHFNLLISNSHGENTAHRLGVPLYQAGFPSYKIFDATMRTTIGYKGALILISDIANIFIGH